MAGIATTAALVLAGLLAWAATAKLARPAATARTFIELGVPAPRALAVAVPVIELATAVTLALAPRAGGVVAAGVIAGFTAFLATRLGSGVACGCFGSAGRDPVSAVHLVRNGLLAALAATAVTAPQPAVPALADIIVVGTAVAIGAVVVALVRVAVDVGRLVGNRLEVSA